MNSRMALITFVDGGSGPDNTLPGGGGRPDNSLPGGGYPSTGPVLPPGGVTLPVWPFDPTDPGYGQGRPGYRPDNSLPGTGGRPDNSLPGGGYPSHGLPGGGGHPDAGLPVPGKRYVVKWIACHGMILVPDNSLPPATIDNTLPPEPEAPPTATPKK